ncbi:MAG: hypothetical protein KAI03_05755 [Candidatus Aureabacteria bacterium]|nr:hypothetical protein [Candidatus Auribacterota bacterium]
MKIKTFIPKKLFLYTLFILLLGFSLLNWLSADFNQNFPHSDNAFLKKIISMVGFLFALIGLMVLTIGTRISSFIISIGAALVLASSFFDCFNSLYDNYVFESLTAGMNQLTNFPTKLIIQGKPNPAKTLKKGAPGLMLKLKGSTPFYYSEDL